MGASTGDVVWLAVWGGLYALVWAVQIVRYRCCRWSLYFKKKGGGGEEERRPTYKEKLLHDHLVLGIFFVHPRDPFTRGSRIFILVFNAALVLTLTSIQFEKSGCIEEEPINWSINFLVRVVQGAVTSMLLVWLFRFDAVLEWTRRRRVAPCCLYDLCTFLTLLVVFPLLLFFCSDFYHQCEVRFVMLKWGVALLMEYLVAQPVMVWVELVVLRKYDVFFPSSSDDDEEDPRDDGRMGGSSFLKDEQETDDDFDDLGLRRYLTSERTPLKSYDALASPRLSPRA